jgi:cobalt-zinc-cadmium efflux system protein
VAVIVGGVLIYLFEIFWIDPLITILVGIYLIRETWIVLTETVDILMQSTPRNINVSQVQAELEKLDMIKNIHHVHIWSLSDSMVHFECHVDLHEDLHVSRTESLLRQMEKILHDRFDVHHTTIQVEYGAQDKKTIIN